jgi:hypothetical protein
VPTVSSLPSRPEADACVNASLVAHSNQIQAGASAIYVESAVGKRKITAANAVMVAMALYVAKVESRQRLLGCDYSSRAGLPAAFTSTDELQGCLTEERLPWDSSPITACVATCHLTYVAISHRTPGPLSRCPSSLP